MTSRPTQLPDPPDCLAGLGDGLGDGLVDGVCPGRGDWLAVETGAGVPDVWGAAPPAEVVVVFFPGFAADPGADPRCPGEEPARVPGWRPGPWPVAG
jgi:hypothetical protein